MEKIYLHCYLLLQENLRYANSCPLISVKTLHQSGMKFQIGNFTGLLNIKSIPGWESEIVNQLCQQTSLSQNLCYCPKMKALKQEENR